MKIEFLNIQKINNLFEAELKEVFSEFLNSNNIVLGKYTQKFEEEFAKYCGTKYSIGVGSGLDAIILILKGLINAGYLKKGDKIIVPANTYIATILAIIHSELDPILVEPTLEDYNVNPQEIEKYIDKKTKAILVVHLYGRMAKMKTITEIAQKYNLLIIEDAAQAHGAGLYGQRSGSFGIAAAFSFYPTKNLGALGEAGAITTNNSQLYNILISLRNYGKTNNKINKYIGINSRIDELQAAFLSVKLKKLDYLNNKRMKIAEYYIKNIVNQSIILPKNSNNTENVWHIFPIRHKQRDKLQKYLLQKNIETKIHYPIPPHKQPALKQFNNLKLPITEKIHKEILSLPINPLLTMQEQDYIIEHLNKFKIQ